VELPNVLNTAAANDLIRHAIGGLLSNEMDPRHAAVLVQLVNCSQRFNQHAELEARLEKLEQAASDAARHFRRNMAGRPPRQQTTYREQGSQAHLHIP